MSVEALPEPMSPPDCELPGYDYMPLFGRKLFNSDLYAMASDEEFRACLKLWWVAWQQCPAGSLPNNDAALAKLADYGRDVKAWLRIKARALHGFVLCSDDRLYHPLICEAAVAAYASKLKGKAKREADAERLRAWRAARKAEVSFEEAADTDATSQDNTSDETPFETSPETRFSQRVETPLKPVGEERREEDTEASASDAAASPAKPDARKELFSEGLALLGGLLGKPADKCRPFLGKLLASASDDSARVLALLREAAELRPADPSAWLTRAAAAQASAQGQEPLPLMPCRGDPPSRWLHLGAGREDDDTGQPHAVVGGYYLDQAADQVCEAARIRSERWAGDWRPLIGWLNDGIELPDVVAVVRQVAARRGYSPPSSLAYFDQAVRERAAA